MNTLKSKLMLFALSLLPMIVLGDLPRPIYIHRLRRIGVDVLPVPNNEGATIMVYVAIVSVLLLMGVGLIVLFKRRMISLLFIWNRCKWFVCKMNRRYMVLMVLLGGFCWVIHYVYFDLRAMQQYLKLVSAPAISVPSMEWRKIYVNEPGWYYSDGVPDSERKAVMAIMTDDLIADLQKAIDEDGEHIAWGQYWQEKAAERRSKENAVLKALKYRRELAERCRGIPVEWLTERVIFGRGELARRTFREWADLHSPNLNTGDNSVLFKWQSYVCFKEGRDWIDIFGGLEDIKMDRSPKRDKFGSYKDPESISMMVEFSDFEDKSSNGVAFVEYWYEKAVSLGYAPDADDIRLYFFAKKCAVENAVLWWKGSRPIKYRSRQYGAKRFTEVKEFIATSQERRKPVKSVRPVAVRLKEAVNRADVGAVRKLIEQNETELKKADVTFDDIFRRFDGSSRQMEIVRLLDEKGFKLPFRDVELAKVFSRKSITDSTVTNAVGYLIDKGADVNEVDFFRNTLLANLCDDNHHKKDLVYVVRFLLEKGANPDLGKKPPLLALTESHRYSPYAKETIKLLLENGANVNVEDYSFFNQTPLENAVKGICDIELVKLLVEHGATITDEIIKWARRRPEVQKYLLEKSGKMEADIYPQRKSKVKFDSSSEKKFDGKVKGAPSFGNDHSHKIHEEMERHMREVREFHENRKPGERFDHDRLRQIHDEHHRRMRELHNGM